MPDDEMVPEASGDHKMAWFRLKLAVNLVRSQASSTEIMTHVVGIFKELQSSVACILSQCKQSRGVDKVFSDCVDVLESQSTTQKQIVCAATLQSNGLF